MNMLFTFLAQMDPGKIRDPGIPPLNVASSSAITWILGALLTAGILLVTFKTSKRNHLDRD